MMEPCFIHCHKSTQKLGFITLDHLQTLLRIINSSLFLFKSELALQLYFFPSKRNILLTSEIHFIHFFTITKGASLKML
uniref:Uncharacterized protein n=1 Tax=Lepeophtheirus salmonis TaxID=72036 RepID=A0A0K2UW55_LEPSM